MQQRAITATETTIWRTGGKTSLTCVSLALALAAAGCGSSQGGNQGALGGAGGSVDADAGAAGGGAAGVTGGGGASGAGGGIVQKGTARTGCTPLNLATSFVTRSGSTLQVGGAPFRAVGTNLYYLQQLLSYAQQNIDTANLTNQIHTVLDDAVCLGITVARTWGFNDLPSDSSSIRKTPGQYLETGLKGLDQAVNEAKVRGLRLIITLTNNWGDYGGLPQYATWRGGGATKDSFYTDATMQQYWKDYVTMLLNRTNTFTNVAYKDEPTILAWEIANELRCQACAGRPTLDNVVGTLATFLKAQGAQQLVGDGGEGMDDQAGSYPGISNTYPVGGFEGASFHNLVNLADLDLVSYHFYPVDWGLTKADAHAYFAPHESMAKQAGKVSYLGEFGWRGDQSGTQVLDDPTRAPIYDGWLSEVLSADRGTLGMFWQLVPTGRATSDNYEVFFASHPATVTIIEKWAGIVAP